MGLEDVELDQDRASELDINSGKYLELTVRDTGSGIEEHLLDRIFEPYFTTKEVGEGTGMGLAVVHGIIKEYEGALDVDSTPGEGSCFRLVLPRTDEAGGDIYKTAPALPRGNETVLLIDDNLSLLRVGREMLEHLGYQVETYTDVQEAWLRFSDGPDDFQVVITDYIMPRMTGIELADRMLAIRPGLAVIVCTGNSQNLDFEKLRSSGVCSLLVKPLVLEELAPALRSALHHALTEESYVPIG